MIGGRPRRRLALGLWLRRLALGLRLRLRLRLRPALLAGRGWRGAAGRRVSLWGRSRCGRRRSMTGRDSPEALGRDSPAQAKASERRAPLAQRQRAQHQRQRAQHQRSRPGETVNAAGGPRAQAPMLAEALCAAVGGCVGEVSCRLAARRGARVRSGPPPAASTVRSPKRKAATASGCALGSAGLGCGVRSAPPPRKKCLQPTWLAKLY